MSIKLCKEGIDNLCVAIVDRSVRDYFLTRFFLDTLELRGLTPTSKKSHNKRKEMLDTVRFFRSKWFSEMYPEINKELLFEAINRRYFEEAFFPMLMDLKKKKKLKPVQIRDYIRSVRPLYLNKYPDHNELMHRLYKEEVKDA